MHKNGVPISIARNYRLLHQLVPIAENNRRLYIVRILNWEHTFEIASIETYQVLSIPFCHGGLLTGEIDLSHSSGSIGKLSPLQHICPLLSVHQDLEYCNEQILESRCRVLLPPRSDSRLSERRTIIVFVVIHIIAGCSPPPKRYAQKQNMPQALRENSVGTSPHCRPTHPWDINRRVQASSHSKLCFPSRGNVTAVSVVSCTLCNSSLRCALVRSFDILSRPTKHRLLITLIATPDFRAYTINFWFL